MKFDHSKLNGRIAEKYGTQRALAAAIGWTESKLSARLNNSVQFDVEEMALLISPEVLDIPIEEIHAYFFTL